jgi:ferredoxin
MLNSFRHAKDQAFYDEANRLARESDGTAKAFWLLTQPESDAKLGVDYSAQGRLDKDKLQAILPFGRYEFYLCGPADFMQQTYDLLIDLGVHDSDIYAEAFGPASMKRVESNTINKEGQADAIADQAVIEFSASGVEQGWAKEDGNLLDFAESHGLTPTFGCRSGSCGSCKVKITHGKVVHSSSATFPVDKDEALLCCAKPKKREGDIPVKLVLEA